MLENAPIFDYASAGVDPPGVSTCIPLMRPATAPEPIEDAPLSARRRSRLAGAGGGAEFIDALYEAGAAVAGGPSAVLGASLGRGGGSARGGSSSARRGGGSPGRSRPWGSLPEAVARPNTAFPQTAEPFPPQFGPPQKLDHLLRCGPASTRQMGDIPLSRTLSRRPPAPANVVADFGMSAPPLTPYEAAQAQIEPRPSPPLLEQDAPGTHRPTALPTVDPRYDLMPSAILPRVSPRRPRTVPTLRPSLGLESAPRGFKPRAAYEEVQPLGDPAAQPRTATPAAATPRGWATEEPDIGAEDARALSHGVHVLPAGHTLPMHWCSSDAAVADAAAAINVMRTRPLSHPQLSYEQQQHRAAMQQQQQQQQQHLEQQRRSVRSGPMRRMSKLLGANIPLKPRTDLSEGTELPPNLLVAAAMGVSVGSYVFSSDARAFMTAKWEQLLRTSEAPPLPPTMPPPANLRAGSAALERMKAGHARQQVSRSVSRSSSPPEKIFSAEQPRRAQCAPPPTMSSTCSEVWHANDHMYRAFQQQHGVGGNS